MTDTLKIKSIKQQDSLDVLEFQNFFSTEEPDSSYVESLNQMDSLISLKQELQSDSTKKADSAATALQKLSGQRKETDGIESIAEKEGVGDLFTVVAPFAAKMTYDAYKNSFGLDSGYGNKAVGGLRHMAALRIAIHGQKIAKNMVDTYNEENNKNNITSAGRTTAAIVGATLGAGAAYTTAHGVKLIHDAIDVGRRAETFHQIADNAGDILQKDIIEKETNRKLIQKAGGKSAKSVTLSKVENKVVKDLAITEAKKQKNKVLKEVTENLGKNMTKAGKLKWDDMAEKLVKNEHVRKRVFSWLNNNGRKQTAKYLSGFITASLIPEPMTTAVGVIGMGLLAYDIYTLASGAKDLMDIFIEADPNIETKVMNSIVSEEPNNE
mgnify:FL=1